MFAINEFAIANVAHLESELVQISFTLTHLQVYVKKFGTKLESSIPPTHAKQ